jgi:hypothetical protein
MVSSALRTTASTEDHIRKLQLTEEEIHGEISEHLKFLARCHYDGTTHEILGNSYLSFHA